MARISKLLDQDVLKFANSELKKLGKNAYVTRKLQAVIAAHKHGITKVAKIYDISRTSLTEWIKHLKSQSMVKLRAPESRKRRTKIDMDQMEIIRLWISNDPSITIKNVKLKIEETMGQKLSLSTVHRMMQKLNFSYITARPRHYKKDEKLVIEFKKKSTEEN